MAATAPRAFQRTLADYAIILAVALSPFQKALTIDVGFPLKPTEILIIIAVPLIIFEESSRRRPLPKEMKPQTNWLLALAVLVGVSAVAHLMMSLPLPPYPGYGRSLETDMMLYVVYAAMVFVVWRKMASIDVAALSKAMSWAVRLAAIFCALQWWLFETGNTTLIKRLGYEMVLGRAFGIDIPRNGPFFEGNNLGVFAVLALLILLRRRDRIGIVAALFCAVYSQSTSALVVLLVSLAVAAFSTASPRWRARIVAIFILLIAVAATVPSARQYVQFQGSKLGITADPHASSSDIQTSYSRDVRGAKTRVGMKMAVDNPIVGVGPGRFGAWFAEYANPDDFPPYYLSGGIHGDSRRIAENGYMQIAAEMGLIALVAFAMFMLSTVMAMRRVGFVEFAIAVAIAVSFATAAAWTLLTLWIGLGFLAAVARSSAEGDDPERFSARSVNP